MAAEGRVTPGNPAAADDPGDPEGLRLISSVTASPLFSGSWTNAIPERSQELIYLDGMNLADGSSGVLTGEVDTARSLWHYTVNRLVDVPQRLASSLFAIKDADAPPESIEIANAGIGLVWPAARVERRPREVTWLLACPTSGTRAHLKTSRNFGFRRSQRTWQGLVSEEELAARMLELFERCAREGGGCR